MSSLMQATVSRADTHVFHEMYDGAHVLVHSSLVAPSIACYAFIKIKLVSRHLLRYRYVVYVCQKSLNFIDVSNCVIVYKQK